MGTRSMDTRSCCVKLTNVSVLSRGTVPRLVGIRPSLSRSGGCPASRPECEPRCARLKFSQEAAMNTYTTVPSGEQVVQELPWRWKVQGKIFLIGGLGFMFDAWDVT